MAVSLAAVLAGADSVRPATIRLGACGFVTACELAKLVVCEPIRVSAKG